MLAVGYSNRRMAAPVCVTDGGGWAEMAHTIRLMRTGHLAVRSVIGADPGDLRSTAQGLRCSRIGGQCSCVPGLPAGLRRSRRAGLGQLNTATTVRNQPVCAAMVIPGVRNRVLCILSAPGTLDACRPRRRPPAGISAWRCQTGDREGQDPQASLDGSSGVTGSGRLRCCRDSRLEQSR